MPRPLRIEYPNACYHVMNRGSAGNAIFHNNKSYEVFLEILGEACQKFEVIIHSYCLMTNHYHLLLQTPKTNLSKFMQHVSGRYTQKYNKFMQTDGPIFRGRFKSILVEKDEYFLNLSRYIHRNPEPLVKKLSSYKWSSYPAYLNLANCPSWLDKKKTSEILFTCEDQAKYKEFVEGVRPLSIPTLDLQGSIQKGV